MKNAALIVAAGRGRRASSASASGPGAEDGELPKQYRPIGGTPLIARSMAAFAHHPEIDALLVVINDKDGGLYEATARPFGAKVLPPAYGGVQRQDSVRAGLEALSEHAPERVLIHDAARPFVDSGIIGRVLKALDSHGGALPCMPVTDTLKRGKNGIVTETVDRKGLLRAQTPQGFAFDQIFQAHRAAEESGLDFTDDASIAEWYGIGVAQVEGSEANRKFTTQEDFVMAEAMLGGGGPSPLGIRTGFGYDVHALGAGNGVTLGGVSIPFEKSLIGHSDADVVLHALTDAILGTIGDGDIGVHFPPSDEQWRGASSDRFVLEAMRRLAARGGKLLNADITLLCERPKIGPHRDAMRSRIAELVGLGLDRVGVKATTHEGLGAIGREEGIAAMATVTVHLD